MVNLKNHVTLKLCKKQSKTGKSQIVHVGYRLTRRVLCLANYGAGVYEKIVPASHNNSTTAV